MGYNDNLTGTWPTNYITQANKDGILDNVAIVAAAAAKRADVVVMLDDALDTDIVTYDKDTNEFVKKQVGISDSRNITLLADSFKGAYYEVNRFDAVTQVRDVAKQTLNWSVDYNDVYTDGSDTKTANLIIDKETKVSHNGGTLFDLQDHQGKVYFVEQNDKLYARFIEVESYTKTVSDNPVVKDNKVVVNKTNYNMAKGYKATPTAAGYYDEDAKKQVAPSKNSNYILYFNDDDQVYFAKSDKDNGEQSYYVKSVGSSSIKLVHGVTTSTKNMNDDDTLIWTGDEFVGPSALKAGDAIMEIADDLYVKVDEVTGELTKSDTSKATIGGKAYVFNDLSEKQTAPRFINDEYDDAGIEVDEVYGNNVKYILDKDNSIAAIMVDETSTGTKLYGIVVDGDQSQGTWASRVNNITIFTAEGKEVTYDLDLDKGYALPTKGCSILGRMVEYQLNKDGEIKKITIVDVPTTATDKDVNYTGKALWDDNFVGDIKVTKNSYLQGKDIVTLASTAVIFEVDIDNDGYIDPAVVTRASLLGGGDFHPGNVGSDANPVKGFEPSNGDNNILEAYAVYVINSNGAVKALAYTNASGGNLKFGVVTAWNFGNADSDSNVTLLDGTTYELGKKGPGGDDTYASNDDVIIYTLSGNTVDVVARIQEKTALKTGNLTKEIDGFNDGLITFVKGSTVSNIELGEYANDYYNGSPLSSVMTDEDTVVFVMNGSTGKYEVGSLEDISAGARVYIPVIDDDKYADLVLVDNYNEY